MQVDPLAPLVAQALAGLLPPARAARGPAPRFAGAAEPAAAGAAPATLAQRTAAPMPSVEMLVALAAALPAAAGRARKLARAGRGLALLERLHDSLATGGALAAPVAALHGWAEENGRSEDGGSEDHRGATGGRGASGAAMPHAPDAQLDALAREVELRVAVELAKLDVRF